MRRLYDETMEGVVDVLIKHSSPSGYTYVAEWNNGKTIDKMDHLVCFAGGMFALGAHGATEGLHARIGAEITETCYQMYARQKTGIAPEITHFRNGQDLVPGAAHYLLRPETVESYVVVVLFVCLFVCLFVLQTNESPEILHSPLPFQTPARFFVLWRLTHDQKYRDWGWSVFNAIETYCKVEAGYSGIKDVNRIPVQYDNYQQSFFLAETLKYLYLLFSDDSYGGVADTWRRYLSPRSMFAVSAAPSASHTSSFIPSFLLGSVIILHRCLSFHHIPLPFTHPITIHPPDQPTRLVPLDKYVFNTEAHPLGVWDPTVPSPWANA